MGRYDHEVAMQSKLKSPDEKNLEEATSGNFHKPSEVDGDRKSEAEGFMEKEMGDVTIGEGSHVEVRTVENCHVEGGIDFSLNTDGSGVDHLGCIDSFPPNGVGTKGEVFDSNDDSGLKGNFYVFDGSTEACDDSNAGEDPQTLDKTLTLAVCSPKPILPPAEHDGWEESAITEATTAATTAADPDANQNERNSDNEVDGSGNENSREVDTMAESEEIQTQTNNETIYDTSNETIHDTNNETIYDTNNETIYDTNNETIHDTNNEPPKRGGDSTGGKKSGVDARSHAHVPKQATGPHRASTKHHKSRRKLQDTVPEIDETADVVESVMRANQASSHNRDKPIKPKTPRKDQNKGSMGCKHSTKEDLHFQFSQPKNWPSTEEETNWTTSKSSQHGVSRSRIGDPGGETPRMNKGGLLNSFLSNIPYDYDKHSRQPRLSPCNSPAGIVNSPRKAGFTSIFERKYTRKELQRALPRKSFFNCHEKAMKDAGLQVEDSASKRKAERLKAKLERIAREFDPLPSKVIPKTLDENLGTNPSDESGGISILVTDAQNDTPNSLTDGGDTKAEHDHLNEHQHEHQHDHKGVISEDPTRARIHAEANIHTTGKKKRLHPEKNEYVDCKPLVHYLEYVRDNQVEYENYLHASHALTKDKPINRLISMGRAFELRHRGGADKTKGDDVIVMAAKALRPRSSDCSKYYKQDNEKSGHRGQEPTIRQTRPPSDDKRRQEKSTSGGATAKDEEAHAKTELERKKLRAEEWATTVSTNTLTRAKIQSLRELGADDEELTKWWVALRKCHYLRTNFVAESV